MRAIHMPPNFTLECKAGPLCRLVCNENGRCQTCMEASARIRVSLFTPGHYCSRLGVLVHIWAFLFTPGRPCSHPRTGTLDALTALSTPGSPCSHLLTGTLDALLCDKEADETVDKMFTEISRCEQCRGSA